MFRKPTVFVLGAGASYECGFPLGGKLASRIGDSLDPKTKSQDQLLPFLFENHIRENRADFERAAAELRKVLLSSPSTDDALNWLSGNRTAVHLGKIGIACEILAAERTGALKNAASPVEFAKLDNTWLHQFFSMAKRDLTRETLGEVFKEITIINFNYDRSLEQYLIHAFHQRGAVSKEDAEAVVASLNVIRPYGYLGPTFGGSEHQVVDYGAEKYDPIALSNRIMTLTEQRQAHIDKQIKDTVQRADVIVFLGFGYHPQNMDALTVESEEKMRSIFATLMGFLPQVTGQIKESIGRAVKTNPAYVQGQLLSAAELLRNYELPILHAAH